MRFATCFVSTTRILKSTPYFCISFAPLSARENVGLPFASMRSESATSSPSKLNPTR